MALKARGIFEYFSSSKTFRLEQAWSALGIWIDVRYLGIFGALSLALALMSMLRTTALCVLLLKAGFSNSQTRAAPADLLWTSSGLLGGRGWLTGVVHAMVELNHRRRKRCRFENVLKPP